MQGSSQEPRSELQHWSEGGHSNALAIADMLGVPRDAYSSDPLNLIATLQNYVSRLPLTDFEQSDWATLHSDLTSYLADVLVHRHGATWVVADDAAAPRGYRYVIEATGLDQSLHRVDPADVVMVEFRNLPIEVTRMIANAELSLGVTRPIGNA
ncbi:hypothetical protein [Streptomyces sp. NPDC019890]|uniref:hypothetical protein n=1 Tax=Streptomyces sp. NPDC019890 TaxID=3365064 RepID=UPI00384E262F